MFRSRAFVAITISEPHKVVQRELGRAVFQRQFTQRSIEQAGPADVNDLFDGEDGLAKAGDGAQAMRLNAASVWMTATAAALAPLVDCLRTEGIAGSDVLYGDDTRVPNLALGAVKTSTDRLWA